MHEELKNRILTLNSKIELAAEKAGRSSRDVRLLPVTKTVPVSLIQSAFRCGLKVFGENRIEEAEEKIPRLPGAEWHLIGHLQSRKVKRALPLFSLIHSVDSVKLLQVIQREAEKRGEAPVQILMEVNVSGEESKYGLSEEELKEILPLLNNFSHIRVLGLMTMAPLSPDPETSRPHFRKLRQIRDEIRANHPGHESIRLLSMGMSQDFEVAIEEGADIIRVGRALFGGLERK